MLHHDLLNLATAAHQLQRTDVELGILMLMRILELPERCRFRLLNHFWDVLRLVEELTLAHAQGGSGPRPTPAAQPDGKCLL